MTTPSLEGRRGRRQSVRAAIGLVAALAGPMAEAQMTPAATLARGRELMQGIVGCGNCHTPQGPEGPLPGRELAGGMVFDEPVFKAVASNITPDPATGIGRWTDAQLARAIREGVRPDGSIIGPPMPIGLYRGIADDDLAAIIAYLRSVPPVSNAVAKSQYRIPLPPNYGPPVGSVKAPPRSDTLAWGAYLAGPLGHCLECHSTPDKNGVPDLRNGLGGGGMAFTGPWGTSVASNITPAGLSRYTDAQLKTVITRGIRPDGSRLKPPMGTDYYARMSAQDLDALVAYLRSLPRR